jgi:dihydroflavonol-4-reductase
MKALVTGASGFVGSAVARTLLDNSVDVRVMLRDTSVTNNITGLPIETTYGDLLDMDSLHQAVRDCDALFHVAADYRLWVRDPSVLYRTNVDGTVNLMRAASSAGVERIVYTSSVATLGINADRTPANEDTPVGLSDMVGHYKRSKFLAEAQVQEMIQTEGLPAVIVNPTTPIGPRDIKPTPTGAIIIDSLNGKIPAYVDTGLNIAHVDDVATGHWLAFGHGEIGQRYILGGENLTLRQILSTIATISGGRPPIARIPHSLAMFIAVINEAAARLIGSGTPKVSIDSVRMSKKHMYFSNARAKAQLGYAPRPASEALQDAIDWFAAHDYCSKSMLN